MTETQSIKFVIDFFTPINYFLGTYFAFMTSTNHDVIV